MKVWQMGMGGSKRILGVESWLVEGWGWGCDGGCRDGYGVCMGG